MSLQGMPGAASSWLGPAHSAYANRCITASTAAGLAAQAFTMAAGASDAYADALAKAQKAARAAIDDARRAQKTIDHAKQEIAAAQGREQAAQTRLDAAIHAQAVAALAPHGDGGAAAALVQAAQHDLDQAQQDERHWTRVLHRAQDDLEDAQKRGRRAEQDAKDAAGSAHALFAAAGAEMPVLPPPPQPVQPQHKDTRHWWEKAADWTWDQAKQVPGGAWDATKGTATGVYHLGHGLAEYEYNSFVHPELVRREQSNALHAAAYMVTHPGDTGKALLDWDDLSHGRIGAWVGGLVPAAVAAFATGGGGAAVRALRGTETVEQLGGRAALTRADANLARARDAHASLPGADGKTVAATRRATLSGWRHGESPPPGFDFAHPDEVKQLADAAGANLPSRGPMDFAGGEPGFPGKYHASHAEAQQLVRGFAQPVGVTKTMCVTCQDMFQKVADHTGQPLLVQDPEHARLFLPHHDGAIVDPTASQLPGARLITGADAHRGLAAGAGADVVAQQP